MLEILSSFSDSIAGAPDVPTALRQLNHVLVPGLGMEVESISLADDLRKASDGDPQAEALRSWRHVQATAREPIRPWTAGDAVLVPVVRGQRIHGVLRVRQSGRALDPFDEDVLLSLGAACADVINTAALHRDLAESEHHLAIAKERERIARDLHDNVGQLVTALGMQLKDYAADASDGTWRKRFEELAEQATQGSRQIKEAIHSLLFLQVRRSGLVSSLRDLVRTFEATSGVATNFEVHGDPGNAPTAKEDVIFRVAHEAFTNIRKHSSASWAEMTLSYTTDEINLAIRDHGRGFDKDEDPFQPRSGHFGLFTLRQRLEEVGGELAVANARPHGVLIQARIPLRRTKTPRRPLR
jgi:signal transduction histidine kinase